MQKDANGVELKKPLSAYMLYNNYRRPVLRDEHPGKQPTCADPFSRPRPAQPVQADRRRVEEALRDPKGGKCTSNLNGMASNATTANADWSVKWAFHFCPKLN